MSSTELRGAGSLTFRHTRHCAIAVLAVSIALGFAFDTPASAANCAPGTGRYVGAVKSEWLGNGRNMRLLAPFQYSDECGVNWIAPSGSVVNGASIPEYAWSIIGGPFEGKYRDASVVHDVACEDMTRPWEQVHEMFFQAMLTSGVDRTMANIMYSAVYYFGPRWPRKVVVANLPAAQAPAALDRALNGAVIGSRANITKAIPKRGANRNLDFEVKVTPPAPTLRIEDFDKLKAEIQRRAADGSGGMSLEEIRNFKPN